MKLYEPDVALTDFLLALECAIFSILLITPTINMSPVRIGFIVFFGASSVAALLGGIQHGFFPQHKFINLDRILLRGILLAVGTGTLAIWIIGAELLFDEPLRQLVEIVAVLAFLVYLALTLTHRPHFGIAVIYYLPAVLFMFTVFLVDYWHSRQVNMLIGAAGTLLMLSAAWVQRVKIALHTRYLSHNALYHVVLGAALLFVFIACRSLVLDRG